MNLRLPVVVAVVAVAGCVAVVRSLHPAAPAAPAFTTAADDATAAPRTRMQARSPQVVVYVAGAVVHRGVYRLPPSSRADDAVRAAGGTTGTADMVAVNLAMPLADGDAVIVPEIGAEPAPLGTTTSNRKGAHRKHKRHRAKHHRRRPTTAPIQSSLDESANAANDASDGAGPSAPIDLNTADANALETLPGVGTKLAERIVTFRELNGPFGAHDDLLDVNGMTQKRLEAIEPFLL